MTTTSETLCLNDIFSNSYFTIPEIQRDYAWDAKDQVTKLFEDIWKYSFATNHETSPQYFLGTVIVYSGHTDGSLQIMDGQQRITTITSLMSAIKIHLERFQARFFSEPIEGINLKQVIHQLEDDFLFEDIKSVKAKLQPKTVESVRVINLMIRSNGINPRENSNLDSKSGGPQRKIIDCLKVFYNFLEEKIEQEDNDEERIKKILNFYNVIRDRVVLTFTKTETMSMAFQMFVSVNGKSMPLNNYDLLRGLLVAKSHVLGFDDKVSKDIKKLAKCMNELKKEVGKSVTDKKISSLVTYWMESRIGKNIQASAVPDVMENQIKNFLNYSEFKDMINQLIGYVNAYIKINVGGRKGNDLSEKPDGYIQHRRILGYNNQKPWDAPHSLIYASLICAQDNLQIYRKSDIINVMRALEWITIRVFDLKGNKVENIYPWASKRCIEGLPLEDWFEDFIEKLESLLDKAEVKGFDHLLKTQISESKATVLLHAIRGSNLDPGPLTTTYTCNACELLPYGAPAPWRSKAEKEEPGTLSRLVGNWFLMKNQTDKEISNYTTSPLERAKTMKKHANTTVETTKLTEIFKEIKHSPGKYTPVGDIKIRTKEIIRELDEYWPKKFEKKN